MNLGNDEHWMWQGKNLSNRTLSGKTAIAATQNCTVMKHDISLGVWEWGGIPQKMQFNSPFTLCNQDEPASRNTKRSIDLYKLKEL